MVGKNDYRIPRTNLENIIGINRIFDLGSGLTTNGLFNTPHMYMVNEVLSFSSMQLAPYYMGMQHLALIQEVLVGKKPIRYNRHRNKLYIDMDWTSMENGQVIIAEAHQVVDPEEYPNLWKDRFDRKLGWQ